MGAERVEGMHGLFDTLARDTGLRSDLKQYGAQRLASVAMLLDCIEPGMHVLELGAQVGTVTVPLARRAGLTGRVVALETEPEANTLLLSNLRLNHVFNTKTLGNPALSTAAASELGSTDPDLEGGERKPSSLADLRLENVIEREMNGQIDCIRLDLRAAGLAILSSNQPFVRRSLPLVCLTVAPPRTGAAGIRDLFGPDYAFFIDIASTTYDGSRFLPWLIDNIADLDVGGFVTLFAVPLKRETFGRWSSYRADPEESAFRQALFDHQHGRTDAAVAALPAIGADDRPGRALFKADLLAATKSHGEALAKLDFHLMREADDADALVKAAQIARMLRQDQKACDYLQRAFALRPTVIGVAVSLSRALQKIGDLAGARSLMEAFVAANGETPKTLLRLAETEWRGRDRDLAIAHARRACEIKPTDVPARLLLSRFLVARRRPKLAIKELKQIDALVPNRPEIRAALDEAWQSVAASAKA